MAAAGRDVESSSSTASSSIGRSCGSIYAAAVLQALMKMEGVSPNEFDPDSSSYAQLSRTIYTLCTDIDHKGTCIKLCSMSRTIPGKQNDNKDLAYLFRVSRRCGKCFRQWQIIRIATAVWVPQELQNWVRSNWKSNRIFGNRFKRETKGTAA